MDVNGLTFEEVRAEVVARAQTRLPDVVVPLNALAMLPTGNLALPDQRAVSLTSWSRRQLAALLGVRWERWFSTTSGDERADEVNRRLGRIGGERKLRLSKDSTGELDGVLRAFLAPAFMPIDDHRIFTLVAQSVRLDDLRFLRVEVTDRASYYAAVSLDPRELGQNGKPDRLYPGLQIRNSEVGFAALTLDVWYWRIACGLCGRLHKLQYAEPTVMRSAMKDARLKRAILFVGVRITASPFTPARVGLRPDHRRARHRHGTSALEPRSPSRSAELEGHGRAAERAASDDWRA